MELRPYQNEAVQSVEREWQEGIQKTLLVMATGTGKTICFAAITSDCVRAGDRVLILAHRGELLEQAAEKLERATGLKTALEKAENTSLGSWTRVTVGSVQTLMNKKRLANFPHDFYQTIIVDEAHHAISQSYQNILTYFEGAKVLGVTATPDRGDMKNLGSYFQSIAYEYQLPRAISDGYLCPIRAQTIPLKLDISQVGTTAGDYKSGELGDALSPYLEKIAVEMKTYCKGKKTVVFLPLVATSKKFCQLLQDNGFNAAEVNGNSEDRKEILAGFEAEEYDILCNSMLLTEGWDCPSVDCIVILRPTKSRSLYCQMVGRGTRLFPGKENLLLLDFLWLTSQHDLCRPAYLIAKNKEMADAMTKRIAENQEGLMLEEAEKLANDDVIARREAALAEQLANMRKRKRKLVDPLQYAMSIGSEELANYQPAIGKETEPADAVQKTLLERSGIFPDEVDSYGKAALILSKLKARREAGLATPKQIRFLESRGFKQAGKWKFNEARQMIDRIAANGWYVPPNVDPPKYVPESLQPVI